MTGLRRATDVEGRAKKVGDEGRAENAIARQRQHDTTVNYGLRTRTSGNEREGECRQEEGGEKKGITEAT